MPHPTTPSRFAGLVLALLVGALVPGCIADSSEQNFACLADSDCLDGYRCEMSERSYGQCVAVPTVAAMPDVSTDADVTGDVQADTIAADAAGDHRAVAAGDGRGAAGDPLGAQIRFEAIEQLAEVLGCFAGRVGLRLRLGLGVGLGLSVGLGVGARVRLGGLIAGLAWCRCVREAAADTGGSESGEGDKTEWAEQGGP